MRRDDAELNPPLPKVIASATFGWVADLLTHVTASGVMFRATPSTLERYLRSIPTCSRITFREDVPDRCLCSWRSRFGDIHPYAGIPFSPLRLLGICPGS